MRRISHLDLEGIVPIGVTSDPTSLRHKCFGFQQFADGKGLILVTVKDDKKIQQCALLLHCMGPELQDMFDALPDTGGATDYDKVEKGLNDYFMKQVNIPYDIHQHREMRQNEDEIIYQYVDRLKRKAELCDYVCLGSTQLGDQIVSTYRSQELDRQFFEKGQRLTLIELHDTVCTFKAA